MKTLLAEEVRSMNGTPCRDCGYMLQPVDRGCPQCALNLEAEDMIDRFIWRRFVPGVILLGILAVGVFVYFVR
jgi:hypothetical protein